MKRVLLSCALLSIFSLAQAQTLPCPVDIKSNQGGGNCGPCASNPSLTDKQATAKVTLTFNANISASCAPRLVSLQSRDGRQRPIQCGSANSVEFRGGRTTIEYCLYGFEGEGNNDGNFLNAPSLNVVLIYPVGCFGSDGTTPVRCGTAGAPLPVVFSSFAAQRKTGSNVLLRWTTGAESNNKGFTVQRFTGIQWVNVGFVPTAAPIGISNTQLNYQFTDLSAGSGRTQYRILQTDFDGRTSFSEIRVVGATGAAASVTVLPNPSSGTFTLLLDAGMGLQNVFVSDVSGRTVRQYRNADQSIRVENLQPGVYAIRVVDARTGAQMVEKAVVQ